MKISRNANLVVDITYAELIRLIRNKHPNSIPSDDKIEFLNIGSEDRGSTIRLIIRLNDSN